MELSFFLKKPFYEALQYFFSELKIPLNEITEAPASPSEILSNTFNGDNPAHRLIEDVYVVGMVSDEAFSKQQNVKYQDVQKDFKTKDYDGLLTFGVTLKGNGDRRPTRSQLAEITRAFNREFHYTPVVVIFKYGDFISFANCERLAYKQSWREGEKTGKVSLLKDISLTKPHTGHLRILNDLKISSTITAFTELHAYWRKVLSVDKLNLDFYRELSAWYYYAVQTIKLPISSEFAKDDKENTKNFVIRLICRTLFCWFLKEKGLIRKELLELYDDTDLNRRILVKQGAEGLFDKQNSYYRGILQNIFFTCLNTPMKGRPKDGYFGKKYLKDDFDFLLFSTIPFLNGGLFSKLEEDNCNDTFDDGPLSVPNELFYSKELTVGSGRNMKTTEGLNRIFANYKFTVAENTPLEEDVALDPELLGMVFENLLAEIDPDETIAKSAKKASGSFYTPRKIIDNMVNESLLLYLGNYFKANRQKANDAQLKRLIYANKIDESDVTFNKMVIQALCAIKVLDPACGSGAFPMGMLHRIVALLNIVDPDNRLWLEKQLSGIEDKMQRANFEKILARHMDDYSRKLGIIKDAIYGIDIQPLAVMITKLRFFISLLIEQQVDLKHPEENYYITPMPNLETKILCADSLKDVSPGLFDESLFKALLDAKIEYYQPNLTALDKEKIADNIVELISKIYPNFASGRPSPDRQSQLIRNRKYIHEWFEHGNLCAPFFNQDIFFPELKHSGFDIVIGNPPYGGTDISDDVKTTLELGSKDPYGAFIARFLGNGTNTTPLKPNGILAYIVSDTFTTIKSHKDLRQQMMNNYIHKMIRVHPDTFKATVNTAIIICERNLFAPNTPMSEREIAVEHHCQMVDMTTVSIHDNYDRFMELLYQTEGFEERESISTPEYAIYFYPQALIRTNSNLPFFVASPKLFAFMNDTTAPKRSDVIGESHVTKRAINLNNNITTVFKLGMIAHVPQGISTGQNDYYLRRVQAGEGYLAVDKELILSDAEIEGLSRDEQLNGVNPQDYSGRYYIPFDKGSETDTENNWLSNYYVPTDYFINWSKDALQRMRSLTIADRKMECGESAKIKQGDERKLAAALRNQDQWFEPVISFSPTGQYSPTFRLGVGTVSQNTSSGIIVKDVSRTFLLGVLASCFARYIFKNFMNHTVHTQEGDIVEFPMIEPRSSESEKISQLVNNIIVTQQKTPRYDYASNEQLKIDQLVYDCYGLSNEDVDEVMKWYVRRYPRLNRSY